MQIAASGKAFVFVGQALGCWLLSSVVERRQCKMCVQVLLRGCRAVHGRVLLGPGLDPVPTGWGRNRSGALLLFNIHILKFSIACCPSYY